MSPHFHVKPINQVIYLDPYSLRDEIPNLGVGFVLEMLSALILSGHGYSAMPLA